MSKNQIGVSPSGKARDFDSLIRKFKSCYPCQKKASRKTCFFLIQAAGLVYHRRTTCGVCNPSQSDGMASRASVNLLRIDAIHHFVMIPYAPSSRFHTATSCGFHTRLRRDWDAESAPKLCTDPNRHTPSESFQKSSPFKNYLQSHRCNGILDRFEPTKAFLREEGGTRSVTEGACATLKSDETLLQRALPQSPAAPAPSQREPLRGNGYNIYNFAVIENEKHLCYNIAIERK